MKRRRASLMIVFGLGLSLQTLSLNVIGAQSPGDAPNSEEPVKRVLHEIQTEASSADQWNAIELVEWDHKRLAHGKTIPMSGNPVKGMEQFDNDIRGLMREFSVPGAAVAIAKKGKIVFARGYGWADIDSRIPVEPDSLFRVASVSKAITAASILKLCEEKKLSLDQKALPLISHLIPRETKALDPQLQKITIRQLLECTAGWDRTRGGDPMFVPAIKEAATKYSTTLRPDAPSIIRNWLSRRVEFLPGTHFAYSNFGYAILGQIIEKVSGQSYADYARDKVLKPIGIVEARPGRTLYPAAKECTYYSFPGQERVASVFPNFKGKVPLAYGGDFCLEAMTADSGWVCSVIDLVKLFSHLDPSAATTPILSRASFETMTAKPKVPEWKDKKSYFGMGVEISESAKGKEVFRQGSLPGSMAVAVHQPDGIDFAFACNSRPNQSHLFQNEVVGLIRETLKQQK